MHSELSLDQSIKNLEQIIKSMETNELDLECAFNYYKEGMQLVQICQEKLHAVEQKIKILDQESNQLKDFTAD
jgi:exodeoxyribonuclease VII small subunit